MISFTKRQWTLGAVLVATLGAVAWVGQGDSAGDGAAIAANRDSKASSTAASRRHNAEDGAVAMVEPGRLIRVVGDRRVGDPFNSASFLPPVAPPQPAITVAAPVPVAPVAPAPAPVPRAPAFPWTFMGRMIDDPQNPAVFLSKADRLTVARIGDTLENSWKINGMDARGLRVEYLPLKSTVTVNLPSGSDVTGSTTSAGLGLQQPSQLAPQLQQLAAPEPPPAPEPRQAQAPQQAPSPVSGIELSTGIGSNPGN